MLTTILTRPRLASIVPIETHLLAHWLRVAPQDARVFLVTSGKDMYHDKLLARIFRKITAEDAPPEEDYIVADLDFIPVSPRFFINMRAGRRATFVEYFTRCAEAGGVRRHPYFTGLWCWHYKHEPALPTPPISWFQQSIGRPLDIADGGIPHLVLNGCCSLRDIRIYRGYHFHCTDGRRWVTYPDVGTHVFNHHSFGDLDAPINTEPGYPPLKVKDHIGQICRHLVSLGTPCITPNKSCEESTVAPRVAASNFQDRKSVV